MWRHDDRVCKRMRTSAIAYSENHSVCARRRINVTWILEAGCIAVTEIPVPCSDIVASCVGADISETNRVITTTNGEIEICSQGNLDLPGSC